MQQKALVMCTMQQPALALALMAVQQKTLALMAVQQKTLALTAVQQKTPALTAVQQKTLALISMQQKTLVLMALQQGTVGLIRVQKQTHTCFQVELLHRVHTAEGPQVDATLKAGGLLQCCNTHTLRLFHIFRQMRTAQHNTAQLCDTLLENNKERKGKAMLHILGRREQPCCMLRSGDQQFQV